MTFPYLKDTLVIGVGHKARQGKDVAAQWLVEQHGATRFAFSDALYNYCRIEHGMTTKDAPLLQRVGVAMRERDPLIWVKAVYYQILDRKPKIAVITDVRFPNEFEFIQQVGGFTCKVSRYNEDGSPYIADDRDPNHPSETALDGWEWDHTIRATSGDIAHLHGEIAGVLRIAQYDRILDQHIFAFEENARAHA